MNLFEITPLHMEDARDSWLPGFLRALLLRTQFSHSRARALGWRGLRPSLAFGESWTCRLQGRSGIFGLFFEGEEMTTEGLCGRFSLHLFPDPDDLRAELLPLDAAMTTQRPDYWDLVREFPGRDETRASFRLGTLEMTAAADGRSLALVLAAPTRRKLISTDGLEWPPGSGNHIVPPGGLESDLAAFGPALRFFRVLAATVTHVLGLAPRGRTLKSQPGWVQWRRGAKVFRRKDEAVRLLRLRLEYGEAPAGVAGGPPRRQPWDFSHDPAWFEARDPGGREGLPELLVLTGFLGSGKTTLLRRFVEHCLQRDRFVAVIQNEIGAVGLDGKLLEQDSRVLEMDEGCVCCSLSGQLKKGLARILERHRPDVVVLEMSGLANPKNLLAELRDVRDLVRRGPMLAVAGGPGLEELLRNSAVARDQLAAADVLVLNKRDLLDPNRAKQARTAAQAVNPRALILEAEHGDIPFGLLHDPALARDGLAWDDLLPHFHEHGTHAGEGFVARTLLLDAPVPAEALGPALERAAARAFRVKGIVDVFGEDCPTLVQAVAGRLETSPLRGHGRPERFLVCIGRDLPEDFAGELARDLGAGRT
ncbi:GTP-binding protein [Desulfovibrio aminophilus]|uniref:CobW family GTP-binding protein n=1 Tax=Desulfovibrio aminophilus TaxID=81425 RepID=UPI003395C93F